MKNIILCDLDGTLADIKHRRHFVERPSIHTHDGTGYKLDPNWKANWSAFFKACIDDTPFQTTIDLVQLAIVGMQEASYDLSEIWIVSGRSDEVRIETIEWLVKHGVAYDRLLMRKAGDYTPDDQLKESWLLDGTIPKERVFCVFDDRDRVVQMWRKHGLTCYQVADGDF